MKGRPVKDGNRTSGSTGDRPPSVTGRVSNSFHTSSDALVDVIT